MFTLNHPWQRLLFAECVYWFYFGGIIITLQAVCDQEIDFVRQHSPPLLQRLASLLIY